MPQLPIPAPRRRGRARQILFFLAAGVTLLLLAIVPLILFRVLPAADLAPESAIRPVDGSGLQNQPPSVPR